MQIKVFSNLITAKKKYSAKGQEIKKDFTMWINSRRRLDAT